MKKWFLVSVLTFFSALTLAASPTGEDAKAMVEMQARTIADKLNNNFNLYKNDPQAFNRLLSKEVLPYMDFEIMAQIALGREWGNITAAQKKDFVNAFRDALISKYSQGWSDHVKLPIEDNDFKVLGIPKIQTHDRADVYAQVKGKNGKQARVAFSLRFKNGQWKMYDVVFENVSILTSYRNTFNGRKVDDLIRELKAGKL